MFMLTAAQGLKVAALLTQVWFTNLGAIDNRWFFLAFLLLVIVIVSAGGRITIWYTRLETGDAGRG